MAGGALLAAGLGLAGQAAAATKTNFDLTISFDLTCYRAGYNPPVAIRTRDIINGLSETPYTNIVTLYSATNGAGAVTNFPSPPPPGWTLTGTSVTNEPGMLPLFSQTARMVFRQVLDGTNLARSGVFVLDGTGRHIVATEVSAWVTNGAYATAIAPGGSGRTYSFGNFSVLQGAPALDLSGFFTTTTGPLGSQGPVVLKSLATEVGGPGSTIFGTGTITTVLSGTITYSGGQLE